MLFTPESDSGHTLGVIAGAGKQPKQEDLSKQPIQPNCFFFVIALFFSPPADGRVISSQEPARDRLRLLVRSSLGEEGCKMGDLGMALATRLIWHGGLPRNHTS